MRIVIIADSIDNQNAGIHVYTRNMIESLEKLSQLEVICVRLKRDSTIRLRNEVIVPSVIPFFDKDPIRILISIPWAVKRLKPDIVIEPAHFGPFNLPKKIKRVTVIHDLTPIKFPQWHNFLSRNLQLLFLPSILKHASLIITNSENTSKDLTEIYPFSKDKIARIYPGIDPFFCLPGNEISCNKEPFFLSVGTIEPRKNLSMLLDAYQLFREKTNFNHPLIICGGKGWKNKQFYRKLKNHPFRNDIKMMGYVSKKELKRLYSTTTAFIYPSLYEGFGFPVAEAMGCGAPCIISNNSSLPEVGGEVAIYIDPEKPEDLTSKLIELASGENLIHDLALKGPVQSARFSLKHFTMELEKFLTGLK